MSEEIYEDKVEIKRHIKYFERCLQVLPGQYASLDTNRMTVAFFALSGIDLLDGFGKVDVDRKEIIDGIYSLQILPVVKNGLEDMSSCGFHGCTMNGRPFLRDGEAPDVLYDSGHVAMTYTALCVLLILGDDLSRVDRQAIAYGLKNLQAANGSFQFCVEGSETDMRFVYCAVCICYILNDFTTIDTDRTVKYILASLSYDGGIGQGPYLEAHGGSTFCAIASLWMMGRLDSLSTAQIESLRRWCFMRQEAGFQGRPNKPTDTCYSFWIGGTLSILDSFEYSNTATNRAFLFSTQDCITGGFSKWPSHSPDPMHSYMGIAAMSLMGEAGLQPLFPALNISARAYDHLRSLQGTWCQSR